MNRLPSFAEPERLTRPPGHGGWALLTALAILAAVIAIAWIAPL